MAAAGATAGVAAALPIPTFLLGHVYSLATLGTVHRFLQNVSPADLSFALGLSTINGYGAGGAFAAPMPPGLSCFIPSPGSPPHGVPHSDMWVADPTDPDAPRCSVLVRLDDDFGILHDFNMKLRQRSGKRHNAAHFVVFPRVCGLTPVAFAACVQNGANWLPCSMRAAATGAVGFGDGPDPDADGGFEKGIPCGTGDLDGVLDTRVRLLYILARELYPVSSGMARLLWNDLMTCITEEKPGNVSALCADRAHATAWYWALQAATVALRSLGLLEYAGILLSALGDELDLDSDAGDGAEQLHGEALEAPAHAGGFVVTVGQRGRGSVDSANAVVAPAAPLTCVAQRYYVEGWSVPLRGSFLREHDAAVKAAAYESEHFRERSVAEAAGSVIVSGVLASASSSLPPPLTLYADGFTLQLVENGAALGNEVGSGGATDVVFGMRAVGTPSSAPCMPLSVPVSTVSLSVVRDAAVPCTFAFPGPEVEEIAAAPRAARPCSNLTLLTSHLCWVHEGWRADSDPTATA